MRNDAGINGDAQRIEQMAWMLFLKVYDTKESDWGSDLVFFGYSDRLAPVKHLRCEQLRPKCTDTSRDFHYVDLMVKDVTSTKNIKAIAQTVEQRLSEGRRTTLVAVTGNFTGKDMAKLEKKFGNYAPNVKRMVLRGHTMGESIVLRITAEP